VDDIARKLNIDRAVLERWIGNVKQLAASKNVHDPWYPWAIAANDPGTGDERRLAKLLKPLADQLKQQPASALTDAHIVVDYSRKDEGWMTDGFAFGPGPARPGDIRLSQAIRFHEKAAAVYDSTWDRLKLAPATEIDPGALSGMIRAGRTIRTPTFTIKPGQVYVLMRGAGRMYAAVEAHNMIAGPLHAQLVRSFQTGPAWQWVEYDLTPYQGRRAHIEFTPNSGSDFALAMVIQSDKKPGVIDRPSQAMAKILAAGSLESMAQEYQRLFLSVIRKLEQGSLQDADEARLANWLLDHGDLVGAKDKIAAALGPWLAEETKLGAQHKWTTHLAPAMWDGSGVNENVFIRGSYKTPGEVVSRRFLEALSGDEELPIRQGSGRLELARQIIEPKTNPFLPRVQVNRLWHHLFGRGIVTSVDNFGALGELPSHPELLDYLADRFVKEGWSNKKMIRALVLSQAYRMSSRPSAEGSKLDPQNHLLHRINIRRLEGEAIRDAMLAVCGRLDGKLFGPPVPVYLNEFQEGRGRPDSGPLDGQGRRSIYLAVRRNFLPAMLLAFDTPIPFSTVGKRTVSNVPAQALILLNDPFVHQQAGVWAKKILATKASSEDRIRLMYQAAFSRPPDESELNACLRFLEQQRSAKLEASWSSLAHVLLNTKEFIFLQ
ncbi:MAG TPA: DUF1553 domain-containing protein, partial [Gemmataceae bacterium]|nr:DUF1553 domain-containing protein [Gemmataceae bacterium]